jgi:predicted Zn-ribbon and HTH transcriptional regulator
MINELAGVKLELTDSPVFPSDQASFERHYVPYLYYSTGLTEHYHQPTDEPATIAYDHLARVTQLVFATVLQVANQDARQLSVDRSRLVMECYVCPQCPFECDAKVYEQGGICPVCQMRLIPKIKVDASRGEKSR